MKISEILTEDILNESIGSTIDKWIDEKVRYLLNLGHVSDKVSPAMTKKSSDAVSRAPQQGIPKELIDKLLNDYRIQKEIERVAWEKRTTVEKIKEIISIYGYKFISAFSDKWDSMSERDKKAIFRSIQEALIKLIMFILNALISSKK